MADIYRTVLEGARDFSILLLDPEGRIELWNRGAEAIFGYTAEEVRGRHFDFLFFESDRALDAPACELDTARRAGRADDTRWHLHKSRRPIFMDGVTTALVDDAGRLTGFSKFGRDITDRVETERRLAAQLALTNLLSRDEPFDGTARRIMQTICENLGWDVGAMWEVRRDRIRC